MKIKKSQLEQLIREVVKAQGGNVVAQKAIAENVKIRLNETSGGEDERITKLDAIGAEITDLISQLARLDFSNIVDGQNAENNLSMAYRNCSRILKYVTMARDIHPKYRV